MLIPLWVLVPVLLVGFLIGRVSRGSEESGVTIIPPRTPEELEVQLRGLLAQGRKIQAIKVYRGFHPVSLKDAKNIVDAMERSLALPPS